MIVKNRKLFIALIIFKFEVSSVFNVRFQAMLPGEKWSRRKRQLLPYGNEVSSMVCPRLESPALGWMNCTQSSSFRRVRCIGGCLPGYAFLGGGDDRMTLRCQDGIWWPQSFFPPCQSMSHCELEHTGRSSFNCTLGSRGTRCDITCNGFYEGRYECIREWRPPLPRCVTANSVWCGEPEILGGSFFNCSVGMEGTQCDVICDGLYEGRYHCFPGQEWRPTLPSCVTANADYCEEPEVPENGRVLFRNGTLLGSELRYACVEGYEMMGADRISCLQNGQWSSPPPQCNLRETNADYCEEPEVPENGRVLFRNRTLLGSELRYVCVEGYEMVGADRISCLQNGQWSSPPPQCNLQESADMEEKVCEDPGPVSNGGFVPVNGRREDSSSYREGTRLKYSCEAPYILRGNETITCESTELWSSDPPTCVEDCGRSYQRTRQRIHHGNKTKPGEWPWTVAISRENGSLVCGGLLVNRRTVLTAAHCLSTGTRYVLRFGKFCRENSEDDDQVLNSRSTRLVLHPNYNNSTYAFDIALIKFFPRIRYTPRIQPVCLPTKSTTTFNLRPNKYGYVTGWGQTETDLPSKELLMAYLPVQSGEKCIQSYGERIRPGMFCAGLDLGTQSKTASACTGDSGSGLVFYDTHHRYTVEGIVSSGIPGQCGMPEKYTIFTRVSDYIIWIRSNIK
ncbi:clotting factor C isoform X1 [Parasteatoda tepidariorum]|uniref:clotting factor C isoform X1 n=1 Tax=Parasteatoda tepidariorum TaxID=114398 RepID=UPI0039BD6B30